MKFTRMLNPRFIAALNHLYADEKSWWRTVVDDKDIFILIRHNELRVQANGGLLIQIYQDAKNNIICKAHEDYLSLRSEANPYVVLEELSTAPIKRIEGLKGFVKHYASIKRRINIFKGKEKQAVQYLASNIPQVVDIEIGFEGELVEDAFKKSAPRIDMAAINDNGTLIFYEVKLFDNSEIRSQKTPKVVEQLQKYKDMLFRHNEDIITAYKEQLKIYSQIKGSFFERRARKIDKIQLHPHARLIITGFDVPQRDMMLPAIRTGIEKGFGWKEGSKDLIATDDFKRLTKSNRLFLGLQ
jgi:hypothetical protein